MKRALAFIFSGGIFFSGKVALAHEAYVIPSDTFWDHLKLPFSTHAFDALKDPDNIHTVILISIFVIAILLINLLFQRSNLGIKLTAFLERYSALGPQFVRYAIAIALFFSAMSGTFLGPELHSSIFPYPHLVRITLGAMSIMIALGLLTEVAALAGIVLFLISIFIFGPYVFTYLNYFGEFIVLLLCGMRVFSLDKYIFGPLKKLEYFKKHEAVIIRTTYGLALIYAAVTVKILHPEITTFVVNTWHLNQFHWLFPSDPLLVTLGAGIVEIVIGVFIIFGFEMRLAIIISLFYITLSLFYFRELVWPHLMLYGVSFYLLLQPETFTLDNLIFKKRSHQKV